MCSIMYVCVCIEKCRRARIRWKMAPAIAADNANGVFARSSRFITYRASGYSRIDASGNSDIPRHAGALWNLELPRNREHKLPVIPSGALPSNARSFPNACIHSRVLSIDPIVLGGNTRWRMGRGEAHGDLAIRECIRGRDAARSISARGPKRDEKLRTSPMPMDAPYVTRSRVTCRISYFSCTSRTLLAAEGKTTATTQQAQQRMQRDYRGLLHPPLSGIHPLPPSPSRLFSLSLSLSLSLSIFLPTITRTSLEISPLIPKTFSRHARSFHLVHSDLIWSLHSHHRLSDLARSSLVVDRDGIVRNYPAYEGRE